MKPVGAIERPNQIGASIVEILIVVAILAVVAGFAIPNLRTVLQGSEERAAIQSIQQTVWQGATAAAARGVEITLTRTGGDFVLRNTESNQVLKTFTLPSGVSSNWPQLEVVTFTPPGKVDPTSLEGFPAELSITANGRTTRLEISLIGEVRTSN